MAISITAVVSEYLRDAERWCADNCVDVRLAVSSGNLDIRLLGTKRPVVKVVGPVDRLVVEAVNARNGVIV